MANGTRPRCGSGSLRILASSARALSEASVGARIYALMIVLKGVAEIEMLCLNNRESFEDNKRILAVYYEQNVTTEKFEDFDGERRIIPED